MEAEREEVEAVQERNVIEKAENDIEYDEFIWSQDHELSEALGKVKWVGGALQSAYEGVKLGK